MQYNRLSFSNRENDKASRITIQGPIIYEKGRTIALKRKVLFARSTSNDALWCLMFETTCIHHVKQILDSLHAAYFACFLVVR